MIHLLVMAQNHGLLMQLSRTLPTSPARIQVIQPVLPEVSQSTHQESSILIIAQEGKSKETAHSDDDLFCDCRGFRMIMLSPNVYHRRTTHRFEMHVVGPAQGLDLPTEVRRES
jgi:hypothetical protein